MQTWVLAVIAFAEAFLTEFTATMAGVWTIQGNQWPPLSALALGCVFGGLAGFRRIGAFYKIPATAALVLLALSGCTTIAHAGPQDIVVNDLTAARDNLQAAAAVGQLPKDDPALSCLNGVVAQLGAPSVEYKIKGLVSVASVAYIKAQAVKQGGPVLQRDCEALIGQFLINGAKAVSPLKLP